MKVLVDLKFIYALSEDILETFVECLSHNL